MNGRLLEGTCVVVTGTATGLGKAMAAALADNGARVLLTDIDEKLGRRAAHALEQQYGKAAFYPMDVSRKADIQAAARAWSCGQKGDGLWGGPHRLVRHAGGHCVGGGNRHHDR